MHNHGRPVKRPPELVQKVADAYIEMAQFLEKLAAAYRERAKHYRAGELDIAYRDLPPDAGAHMRHPAQRAIDGLSEWDVHATYERVRARLQAEPSEPRRVSDAARRAAKVQG